MHSIIRLNNEIIKCEMKEEVFSIKPYDISVLDFNADLWSVNIMIRLK